MDRKEYNGVYEIEYSGHYFDKSIVVTNVKIQNVDEYTYDRLHNNYGCLLINGILYIDMNYVKHYNIGIIHVLITKVKSFIRSRNLNNLLEK